VDRPPEKWYGTRAGMPRDSPAQRLETPCEHRGFSAQQKKVVVEAARKAEQESRWRGFPE
jgi:hypothetical protein